MNIFLSDQMSLETSKFSVEAILGLLLLLLALLVSMYPWVGCRSAGSLAILQLGHTLKQDNSIL